MTDGSPENFPAYQVGDAVAAKAISGKIPGSHPIYENHKAGKPMIKLMTRALRGRKGKSLFNSPAKRRKSKIV